MKKGFLKGFVLIIFFLACSIVFLKENAVFALVETGPETLGEWTITGGDNKGKKAIDGKKWVMDSGRVLIVYKVQGEDKYVADYYEKDQKEAVFKNKSVDTPEAGLAEATTQDKKTVNEERDRLKSELAKRG